MSWKLYTSDTNVAPPLVSHQPYTTREEALRAACDVTATRVQVLHIEGPARERMEADEIGKWCQSQSSWRRTPVITIHARWRGQEPADAIEGCHSDSAGP